MISGERAHRRLEGLYEISKLFTRFENVEQRFDPALGVVARTLPLRSAVLIETDAGYSRMIVWPSEGQTAEELREVKAHVEKAYAYLIGAPADEALEFNEQAGITPLPRPPETGTIANRFIVIPLVVARRPPFGALQLEGAQALDETDLIFVNALANQLAIALDRDRAWRQDITRRQDAEEGRTDAEVKGATAELERANAESASYKYEKLAAENARLYEHAQLAVGVREQILAIVSHDLRNPLGAILMTVDALEMKGAVPDEVGRIKRSAERMLRLIGDLLDFSSIEAGHLAMNRRPLQPGQMMSETLTIFESVARGKSQQLTANVAPDLPSLTCDRDRIIQVLSNLVSNATKATPRGGHISIRVQARVSDLLFSVSDDGPGISAEDLGHLFERYWRGGETRYKGTGLGLAIARGIVGAHGGEIWAESVLGQGATFFFTIPTHEESGLISPSALPAS